MTFEPLVPLEPSDLNYAVGLAAQDGVAEALLFPRSELNAANLAKWLTTTTTGEPAKVFALKERSKLTGIVTLNDIDWQNRKAVGRYAFVSLEGSPLERGRRMLHLLSENLRLGFASGLNRIETRCREDNEALLTAYRLIGGTVEGVLHQAVFFDGKFHNLIVAAKWQSDNSI